MGILSKSTKGHKTTMDVYVKAVEQVAETWQTVKTIPNYEEVVGQLLFRQIFEIAPMALSLYSFRSQEDFDAAKEAVPDSIYQSPAFLSHARGVVTMLEKVIVMMLGNDMDTLAESLKELGRRHVDYGVHPAHYRIVETALVRTLAGALGEQFTEEVRRGWMAVFKFISKAMMAGAEAEVEIVKDQKRKLERGKSATLRLKVLTGNNRKGSSPLSTKVSIRAGSASGGGGESAAPCLTRTASPPRPKSRKSYPPRKPTRRQTLTESAGPENRGLLDRRWSELSPFREDDDLTSDISSDLESLRQMDRWSVEDSRCSDTPPPNIIVIHCSPSSGREGRINNDDDSHPKACTGSDVAPSSSREGRNNSEVSHPKASNSSDVAPRMPRRRIDDDNDAAVVEKSELDGTDLTIHSFGEISVVTETIARVPLAA